MKKLSCILAAVLLVCLLSACSDSYGELQFDDFDLYQFGEETKRTEIDYSQFPEFSFASLEERNTTGVPFSTKRGVRLGDTFELIKKKYNDIYVFVVDNDQDPPSEGQSENNLAVYLARNPEPKNGKVLFDAYSLNGKIVPYMQVYEEANANSNNYAYRYNIIFVLEDSVIVDITMSRHPY